MNDDTLDKNNKNNDRDGIEARHEPELEARLVAWIAGELSDFEAAELEQLVKARPELARFKARMELVRELVAEAAKPDAVPLRLSAERRAKLLQTLGADAEVLPLREQVVVLPPKRAWWRTARGRGTMIGAGMAAGLAVGLFSIVQERRVYESAVVLQLPKGEEPVTLVQQAVDDHSVRSMSDAQTVAAVNKARAERARQPASVASPQASDRAAVTWKDVNETNLGPSTMGAGEQAGGQVPRVTFNVPAAPMGVPAVPTFADVGTRVFEAPAVAAPASVPVVALEGREGLRGVAAQDELAVSNAAYNAAPGRGDATFSSTILTPRRPDPDSTLMGPTVSTASTGAGAMAQAPTAVTFDVPEARPAASIMAGETFTRPMGGSLVLSTFSDSTATDSALMRQGPARNGGSGIEEGGVRTISAAVAGFDSGNVEPSDKSVTTGSVGQVGSAPKEAFAFSLSDDAKQKGSMQTTGSITLGAAQKDGSSVTFGGGATPPLAKAADALAEGRLNVNEAGTLNLTSRLGSVVGGTMPARDEAHSVRPAPVVAVSGNLATVTGGMLADAGGRAGAKAGTEVRAQRAVASAVSEPVIQLQAFTVAAPEKKVAVRPRESRTPRGRAGGGPGASGLGAGETSAAKEAVSTFSLHVSDVSWRLMQAAIAAWGRGETPELPTVRVGEIHNAFDYGDPFPTEREKVTARIEQAAHPVLQERNLMRIALRVAATGRAATQPLRLTVLLDTSGSMEREDRRAAVGRALSELVALLGAEDRVTLIGFARQPRLLAENVRGNQAGELVRLAMNTPPDGGTNLEEALKLAGELAVRHRAQGAQNRIVLLTDGAANLGDAEPERLMKLVEGMRERGVAFDACGVGLEGVGDAVLEALTRKGDGRYYVLERAETADATFARKLAGAFRPAAENVKVQVRFNPARVGAYRLIGFDAHRLNEADFRNDRVDAAELSAEEAAVAMYQVEPLPQGTGDLGEVSVRFRDPATGEMVERSWVMPYEAQAPALRRASPSMQLAGVATMLAEGLAKTPVGEAVELRTLAPVVGQLRGHFPQQGRVRELAEMFEQLRRMER